MPGPEVPPPESVSQTGGTPETLKDPIQIPV